MLAHDGTTREEMAIHCGTSFCEVPTIAKIAALSGWLSDDQA